MSVTRRYSSPWCLCSTAKWLFRKKTQRTPSSSSVCSLDRPQNVNWLALVLRNSTRIFCFFSNSLFFCSYSFLSFFFSSSSIGFGSGSESSPSFLASSSSLILSLLSESASIGTAVTSTVCTTVAEPEPVAVPSVLTFAATGSGSSMLTAALGPVTTLTSKTALLSLTPSTSASMDLVLELFASSMSSLGLGSGSGSEGCDSCVGSLLCERAWILLSMSSILELTSTRMSVI
mmetsp:Transcript_3183/g.5937  ORF Transcript_3183/g.5937 Transcript_3183/m.5937 type:complete len:232 (-) Transcript_3183:482-1177(-)